MSILTDYDTVQYLIFNIDIEYHSLWYDSNYSINCRCWQLAANLCYDITPGYDLQVIFSEGMRCHETWCIMLHAHYWLGKDASANNISSADITSGADITTNLQCQTAYVYYILYSMVIHIAIAQHGAAMFCSSRIILHDGGARHIEKK